VKEQPLLLRLPPLEHPIQQVMAATPTDAGIVLENLAQLPFAPDSILSQQMGQDGIAPLLGWIGRPHTGKHSACGSAIQLTMIATTQRDFIETSWLIR
jgi:hypothetical protein